MHSGSLFIWWVSNKGGSMAQVAYAPAAEAVTDTTELTTDRDDSESPSTHSTQQFLLGTVRDAALRRFAEVVNQPGEERSEATTVDVFEERSEQASPKRLPTPSPSPYRFRLLQQWEGTVTELDQDEFTATLRDLTDETRPSESANFSLDEVSESDLPLVALGAVFRWSIGYRTRKGQKERVSNISFLRLPAWSATAAERVGRRATELRDAFPAPEDH